MNLKASPTKNSEESQKDFQVKAPSVKLPKGGGAVRGIGEKFAANPVTGTGSMTVPIAVSPGRSGFGPQLSLSYDSGSGNGPFGFGWSLSLPSITRKTDKGLPQYRDAEESDVYMLSGAEDLVPVLQPDGSRYEDNTNGPGYTIHRYRPRIEGLFARIERWTDNATREIHWRSITRDNITTIYGNTENSRIADPDDPGHIFTWMICESRDDKGNAIVYEYEAENGENIDHTLLNEHNRIHTANRYLKRVKYGNRISCLIQPDLTLAEWMFEVVFDYGEGHYEELAPDPHLPETGQHQLARASASPGRTWPVRPDPFSSYRSSFEVRTYRRCQRVLIFHHFTELWTEPCLVKSTEFNYADFDYSRPFTIKDELDHQGSTRFASFIHSITQSGFLRDDTRDIEEINGVRYLTYFKKSMPPLEFEYSKAGIREEIQELDADSIENLPVGLDRAEYQWVDLDGEGLSGILTEQAGGWYYKGNLSPINQVRENGDNIIKAKFSPQELVAVKPASSVAGAQAQFLDLAGDGRLDLVDMAGPLPGFYERTHNKEWHSFKPFTSMPNIPWDDPNLRFVDLNGDGHADVLITEQEVFTWYPSMAEDGFGPARERHWKIDEEQGPRLMFADGTQSIYLADMCGDGLNDLVRIRNGEVCYWPNQGYGIFGTKVTMDNAPWFDNPDQFDHKRIRLADIDGSGTSDIIYLGRDTPHLYFNQSGNLWSKPYHLHQFPHADNLSSVTAADLLGNGTACLVWSSPLQSRTHQPMRYIDLMGGQKPHLLFKVVNNLGAETHIQYAPSTRFYLADKTAGKPWVTRLPFPVHCVEKVTVTDTWRKSTFSTQYTYHHGYFDGFEREFRGFGRVEQVDVETYGEFASGNEASPYISDDKTLYQPPVKTITWFHTGAFLDRERILNQFQEEYFPNWLDKDGFSIDSDYAFAERALPEPDLTHLDLDTREWCEALRACKGMPLRQEVYELDVDALEASRHVPIRLFSAAGHNCQIRRIQPRTEKHHAVFLVTESEAITYHYELDMTGSILRPDPRITHTLVLNTNEYGQPLQQAAVAYPHVRPFSEEAPSLPPGTEALIRQVQAELHIAYTETRYTDDIDSEGHYRLRLPCEVSTFEVTGIRPQDEDDRSSTDPWDDIYFTLEELRRFRLSETYQTEGIEVETIPYHLLPDNTIPQKRRVEQVRTLYFHENLVDHLPFGELNPLCLLYETYKLALTNDLLDAILREKLEDLVESGETYTNARQRILHEGGYHHWEGQWWIRSGIAGFASDAGDHFYLPERYTNPFNQVIEITYDPYDLYIRRILDPLDNITSVEDFDFRVLAPARIRDPNDNLSAVAFDTLGLPAGAALMGNEGTESGDSLTGFHADLSIDEVSAFFTGAGFNEVQARDWLGRATTRFVYCLGEGRAADGTITYGNHPASACGISRERHVNQLAHDDPCLLQTAFEYTDGLGQMIVTKTRAEPETPGGPLRWLAIGKTILNNKGKPVKQYEPYFSEVGHRFEEPREAGVTPVIYYDAVGRLVRTEQPNGAYSRVEFSPWHLAAYDSNDTVLEAENVWYARNSDAGASSEARRASRLTAVHAGTPAVTHLDSLGREVIAVAHNRHLDDSGAPIDEKIVTFTKLDAEGKPLWIRDSRGNLVMQYITPPIADGDPTDPSGGYIPCYDIAGNLLFQHSMDAGERWMLNDVTGKPLYSWDSRNNLLHTTYDPLRRPVQSELRNDDHADWIVVGCIRYGDEPRLSPERAAEVRMNNLRGRPYRTYDQSGLITNIRFDFKGNALETRRRLALNYETDIDWRTAPALSPGEEPDGQLMDKVYHLIAEYDALNRVTRQYNWHRGTGSLVSVVEPRYNRRGLLEQEDVVLDAIKTDGGYDGGTRTPMVRHITYNEKGQRLNITYGNDTTTTYTYDTETFRLLNLQTQRNGDHRILQDLYYTYDPSGNITEIIDNAQPRVFFNNLLIDTHNRYTYDALYRLIQAEGREHAGQVRHNSYDNWHDCPFRKRYHPNDAMAWRNYTEHYGYDSVGNILSVRHTAHGDSTNSWTRQYQYEQTSNRLLATGIGIAPVDHYPAAPSLDYRYTYNIHGSMTAMPHLPTMEWNFTEHLHHISRAAGTQGEEGAECPDTSLEAWYCYDAAKQRTRKRVVKQGGLVEERLYLGGVEIFRRVDVSGDLLLERETLHIMDDQQRIAMVENLIQGSNGSPDQLIRYQFANHLGSVSLELDTSARVISYEEYYPYGGRSYQAMSELTEVPKRYGFADKERDEESGFCYHEARYYTHWLGRWTSVDPDKAFYTNWSSYSYAFLNPLRFSDPTGRNPVITQTVRVEAISRELRSLGESISELESSMSQVSSQMADAAHAGDRSLWETLFQRHQDLARQRASAIGSLRQSAVEAVDVIQDAQRAIDSAPSSGTLRTGAPSPNQVQDLSRRVDDLMEQLTDRSHGLSRHIPRSTRRAVVQASEAVVTATGNFFSQFGWPSSGTPSGGVPPPAPPPTSAPSPPSTSRPAAGTASDLADDIVEETASGGSTPSSTARAATESAVDVASDVVEETTSRGRLGTRVARRVGQVAGHVPRAIPYVGAGAGAASAASEFSQGHYGRGTLDVIGMIPLVGDFVDLGRVAGDRIMRRHHIRMQRIRRGQTPNIAPGLLGEIMSWLQ